MLLVATIAAVVSYIHIQHLAVTHGQDAMAAALLPLSIDGTVTTSSLVLLRAARAQIKAPALAQVMLALSVLATLAANVAYGASFGLTGALISGWPAVAFIGCAEMAITMARRARATVTNTQVMTAAPVPAPVPLPTHRQVREQYQCGPATAKKIRAGMAAAVKAGSNGHPTQ